jgi:hypothetical protein
MFCKVLLNVNIRQHGSHFTGEVNITPDISVTFLPFAYNLITLQPWFSIKFGNNVVLSIKDRYASIHYQVHSLFIFSFCQISRTVVMTIHLRKHSSVPHTTRHIHRFYI